jgi:ribosomal protein S3AE
MVVEEFQGYKRSLISKAKLEIIIEQRIPTKDDVTLRLRHAGHLLQNGFY